MPETGFPDGDHTKGLAVARPLCTVESGNHFKNGAEAEKPNE